MKSYRNLCMADFAVLDGVVKKSRHIDNPIEKRIDRVMFVDKNGDGVFVSRTEDGDVKVRIIGNYELMKEE